MIDEEDDIVRAARQRVGTLLGGKWTLERLLGVGGMAAVYAATHRNGAKVAVKLLHGALAAHEEALIRFRREAHIANKVDHPAVVKVFDDDVAETGEPFLVMELLAGVSVDEHLRANGGRLSVSEALGIADRTLSALEAAHEKGIVHRDLKPENLFLTAEGELKVLDFGIARLRESEGMRRTRTGMLMGTPAFMAPEQALGRWSDVDGRTDIWAVGAILFTLLTGRAVHQDAPNGNEMIIWAGTRPAPSIARFVELPVDVVRLVDRALAFDMSARFTNAEEMRTAVRSVSGARRSTLPPPPLLANPVERKEARGQTDEYDPAFATSEDITAMVDLFTLLERALFAGLQYGLDHPEAERRLDGSLERCVRGLSATDTALVWNVTPYGFAVGAHMVWEPRAPFDRVPYQLFSDGVRLMGLLPGLDAEEFKRLVRIVTMDRAREMAPEDDFVTLLWEAGFQHVVYQAIDAFVEGDQTKMMQFEEQTGRIAALAQFDTAFQLEDCWADRAKGRAPDGEDRQRRLAALLRGERLDTESVVKAEAMTAASNATPNVLLVADETKAALALQLGATSDQARERFVLSVALAWDEATRAGTTATLIAPLRSAVDGLAPQAPTMAIAFVSALCDGLDKVAGARAQALRASLAGAIVSPKTMEFLFEGACAKGADAAVFIRGLEVILANANDAYVGAALAVLTRLREGSLQEYVLSYLARAGRGHEARMGDSFVDADLDLGLALIRVLSRIGTAESKSAILRASMSKHPVVRIEALSHVEGAGRERARLELKALLEDREMGVRLAALRAMQQHNVRVAGPALVLRIRSPEFDKLQLEEKQQALDTLASLAPSRAESVCLEILAESHLVSTEAHEQSRALAAELLGRIGASQEVLEALGAATSKWRNSERVRQNAQAAQEQVQIRLSQPPLILPRKP